MQINIKLDGNETPEQLFNLGAAFHAMSGMGNAPRQQQLVDRSILNAASVPNAPVTETIVPEIVAAVGAQPEQAAPAAAAAETEAQATTRKRRTKAEIEAAKAAEAPAAEPTPEPTAEPQPEPDAEPEAAPAEQTPAANDPAPVASGRVWTNDEVQAIAVNVARRHTPSAVTSMLTEYGAARINMLSQENLNLLAERLTAKLAEAAEKAA
jgi:hypothetical protein